MGSDDIRFGLEARDKVTGFVGIVTGRCEYLYGCNQWCLTPKVDKEGKRQDVQWFDEGRLEVIGSGIQPAAVQTTVPGCEVREHPDQC